MAYFRILLTCILLTLTSFIEISAQSVTVDGRKIFVDGQRYRINGICYNRGGVGNYTEDIKLLKEANINTIRTYHPILDTAELNAFANAGIKIIMGFGYNQGGNYDLRSGKFLDYIELYKDHDAILLWEFGNEYNYHPEWFEGDINNWYRKLENCAIKAKEKDSNHPVASAHGEVPTTEVFVACPSVDVWGLNLYRYDDDVPAIYEFSTKSEKAMYISEAGADSYNKKTNKVDYESQAIANRKIITGIIGEYDLCLGVTMFEFCDEWWKAGQKDVQNLGNSAPNSSGVPYDGSADEEYWGIVRQDRTKKPVFYEMQAIYAHISSLSSNESHYFLAEKIDSLLYPNPETNILTIKGISRKSRLEIYNMEGEMVIVKRGKGLDVSALNPGTYILKAEHKGIISEHQFVKK
jgi:hypothetical protein